MVERLIFVKDYVTKSNLPASDYVINPYIGCPHSCKYCYARFMKRFTGHDEPWGEFIDIKKCDKLISAKRLKNKTVFLSSVTDCYNPFEEKYQITRKIIEQLVNVDCTLHISTKSSLILRDIDLLKQFKNLKVAISVNTLDEEFRKDMDKASSIQGRLNALHVLKSEGIYTVLFISPIFPYLTDFENIIIQSKKDVNEYWFENLNLRGDYKKTSLDYIKNKFPQYYDEYVEIYIKHNNQYWVSMEKKISEFCGKRNIKYMNYFYHKKLVAR